MKLNDLFETNFEQVHFSEPSGNAPPTSVDPDKFNDMMKSKRLRRKLKFAKKMRSPLSKAATVKHDNEDLTGSGAHSVVNGPFKY